MKREDRADKPQTWDRQVNTLFSSCLPLLELRDMAGKQETSEALSLSLSLWRPS